MTKQSHPGRSARQRQRLFVDPNSLRILHIHTIVAGSGGDKVSELEARYMASKGHEVTIVGPTDIDFVKRLASYGVNVLREPVETRSVSEILDQTGDVDIVHCHCVLSAPFAADLARNSEAALLIHAHSMGEAWWECEDWLSHLRPKCRRLRALIDQAFNASQSIVCVSEAVRNHLGAIGLPAWRASVLPNPIEDIFFRDAVEEEDEFDVAIVARPSRAKRPLTALRVLAAANRLRPGLRIVWIGPLGRWSVLLRSIARLLRLAGLKFTGRMSPEQVCQTLDRTKVLLSASSREGEPLSILEAMARSCSVFLSDIPAHRAFSEKSGVAIFSSANVHEAGRLLLNVLDEHVRRPPPDLSKHTVEAHGSQLLARYKESLRCRN